MPLTRESRPLLVAVTMAAALPCACRATPDPAPTPAPPPLRIGLSVAPASLDPHEQLDFKALPERADGHEAAHDSGKARPGVSSYRRINLSSTRGHKNQSMDSGVPR